MKHVFISYKHEEDEAKRLFIQLLKLQLKSSGLEVWIDEKIQGGEDWRERVETALKDAFACFDFTAENYDWETLQRRLQDIRLEALLAKSTSHLADASETDRRSNMIFSAISEAYRHNENREVTPTHLVSMLGFRGLLNLDHYSELLRIIQEHQNRPAC